MAAAPELAADAAKRLRNNRHTSETAEWYTPPTIVEAARATLCEIDLDPASTVMANQTVKAARFYDELDNGLLCEWGGRVFLNPPGGRCDEHGQRVESGGHSAQKAWWFKLAREFASGRVTCAVFLGFSIEILQTTQVDPPVGLPLPLDFPLCFPSRRIPFIDETGVTVKGNTHASVIVLVGNGSALRARFERAFMSIGRVRG